MMAKSPTDIAKRQRFVSILCRYPHFHLKEDEDEQAVIKEYGRRSKMTLFHFHFHFRTNF